MEDPGPGRRPARVDLRRFVARGRPVDRVVLGDHSPGGVAAWRVRRAVLDELVARVLAVSALIAVTIAGLGLQLHGRPTISILQFVELALILAFVGWGLSATLFRRPGYFTCFLIAVAALWAGGEMITTLLYGFVLISLPAFLARVATIVCLGTGVGLLLLVFRLSDYDAGLKRSR